MNLGPDQTLRNLTQILLASLYSPVFSEFPTMDIYCFHNQKKKSHKEVQFRSKTDSGPIEMQGQTRDGGVSSTNTTVGVCMALRTMSYV